MLAPSNLVSWYIKKTWIELFDTYVTSNNDTIAKLGHQTFIDLKEVH